MSCKLDKKSQRLSFLTFAAGVMAAFFMLTGTAFAGMSDWNVGTGYKVRMVHETGGANDGVMRIGVQIEMEKGWKTYWRSPGDSGIAPTLSFENSINVEEAHIHWPEPVVFWAANDNTIGYKNKVILPIELKLKKSKALTVINLNAFFGVCDEVCVPADEQLTLMVPPITFDDPEATKLVASAFETVPPDMTDNAPQITSATLEGNYVLVTLPKREKPDDVTVIVEGGDAWFFDPVKVSVEGGKPAIAKVPYARNDGGTDMPKKPFRITVLEGPGAWEQAVQATEK